MTSEVGIIETVTEAVTDGAASTGMTASEFFYKGLIAVLGEQGKAPIALWIIAIVFCALLGYFLGSINFAVVISKIKFKDDIRKHGSGNAGATNMSRTYGKGAGIATLCGDILKTVVSVMIARTLCGDIIAYMTGMFCALGHAFPCYYKFKGGKCVAVTAAMALTLEPLAFLFTFLVFAAMFATTKYVSMASISAALMYPLFLNNVMKMRFGHGDLRVVFVLITCLLVVFLHKENIIRLRDGKENKFSFKKKDNNEKNSEK